MRQLLIAFASLVALGIGTAAHAGTPTPTATPLRAPSAPSDLHEEGSPAHLVWTDNSADEDGFRLMRSCCPDQDLGVAAVFPANTTTSPVVVESDSQYCARPQFYVVAFNAAGESAPSNKLRVEPPPSGCPIVFERTFTNDTAIVADTVYIGGAVGLLMMQVIRNAPGCPEPIDPGVSGLFIHWPVPCIDPGESIDVRIYGQTGFEIGPVVWQASPTPAPTPRTVPPTGGPRGGDRNWLYVLAAIPLLALGTLALKRIR
jgi:hypothetical protein